MYGPRATGVGKRTTPSSKAAAAGLGIHPSFVGRGVFGEELVTKSPRMQDRRVGYKCTDQKHRRSIYEHEIVWR